MKKLFLAILAVFCFLMVVPIQASAEESNLDIKIETGIDGRVKMFKGFPLNINVTNNGSDSFSGELVIRFNPSYSSPAVQVIPINIDANQTKNIEISMSALTDQNQNPNRQDIFLFKGGWENGEEVTFTGSKRLTYSAINPERQTIGLLSENPDRLATIRGINTSLQFLNIDDTKLPQDALGMEIFDVLIIDEYPVASLSEDHQNAIIQWVKNGGTLLVGATPNAQNAYGKLNEILPLKITNETTIDSIQLEEDLILSDVPVIQGDALEETVRFQAGNQPILLENEIGKGKVLQTAFSIGDGPITKTEGFPEWIVQLIVDSGAFTAYWDDINSNLYWEIGELNEIFSESAVSTTQLIFILIVYMIIIVPVLYFILKKKDKREYAWWIIPSISILASILIFAFGAKDRIFNPMKNEVGIFYSEGEYLNGYYAIAIQSNTSGDYLLSMNKGEYSPIPVSRNYQDIESTNINQLTALIENRESQNVVFPNVEYWSTRSILGKVQKDSEGSFKADLTVSGKKLTGEITNDYPFDFDELFIWSGTNKYNIGSIKQGETIPIDLELKTEWLKSPMSTGYYGGPLDYDNLDDAVRDALQNSAANHLLTDNSEPVIAGFTRAPVINVEMENKNDITNRQSLIIQSFSPNIEYEGSFRLNKDIFSLEVEMLEGQANGVHLPENNLNYSQEIWVEPGVYQFIYHLPEGMDVNTLTVNEIGIRLQNVNGATWSLYNQITGKLMPLDDLGTNIKITENARDFISTDGTLVIQIHKTIYDAPVFIPELTMEGSVGQ